MLESNQILKTALCEKYLKLYPEAERKNTVISGLVINELRTLEGIIDGSEAEGLNKA